MDKYKTYRQTAQFFISKLSIDKYIKNGRQECRPYGYIIFVGTRFCASVILGFLNPSHQQINRDNARDYVHQF